MEDNFQHAIAYVRENRSWSDEEDAKALQAIDHYRCSIDFAAPQIHCEICRLMDEYGEQQGLPSDWWRENGDDEDDIFFAL